MRAAVYMAAGGACICCLAIAAFLGVLSWVVYSIQRPVRTAAVNVAEFTERVNRASIPLLECRGNPGCLPSQAMATLGAIKATAGAVAKAAPETSEAARSISKDLQASATDLRSAAEQAAGAVQEASGRLTAQIDRVAAPTAATARNLEVLSASWVQTDRLLMDCKANPACLPSKVLAFTGAATHAAGRVSIAADRLPEFLATSQKSNQNIERFSLHLGGIASDVHILTTNWTKPQPWYRQLWQIGRDTARIGATVALVK